ncbi:MAG: MotA/TolQ/ExbB proton channel family protein [Candidatus Electryoneaceae bacterium]|nr:MotA/TolQ/ExbB proton channel family protein [Candidatus Electryoneaceae bacterium]
METVINNFFASFSMTKDAWQFMWVILFYFIAMLAITIERWIYVYVRSNINATLFMDQIRKLVSKGDLKKGISLCNRAGNKALPQVVKAALEEADRKEFVDFRAVQSAVDESTLEIIPRLNKRTNWLSVLGNISTLTGLLGTIVGLMISFAAADAGGGSEGLAVGIAVAMQTTMWGLIVAIPSNIMFTFINTKTTAILDDIDEHSVKLIHLLTGGK